MVPHGPGGGGGVAGWEKEGGRGVHRSRPEGGAARRELVLEQAAPGVQRGDPGGMPEVALLNRDGGVGAGRARPSAGAGGRARADGPNRRWEGLKLPPLRSRAGGEDLSPQPMLIPLGASPPRPAVGRGPTWQQSRGEASGPGAKLEARTFRVSPIVPPPGHRHPATPHASRPAPPKEKMETAAATSPRPHHPHRTPPKPQPASLCIEPDVSFGLRERHGPAERSPLQDATGGPGMLSDACLDYTPTSGEVDRWMELLRNRKSSEESVKAWRQQFDGMMHQGAASNEAAHRPADGLLGSGGVRQQSSGRGGSRPQQEMSPLKELRWHASKPPELRAAVGEAPKRHAVVGQTTLRERLGSPPLIGCDQGLNQEGDDGDVDIDEETMMSLVYDAELECFFDPNTQRYFKLKFKGPFDGLKTIQR